MLHSENLNSYLMAGLLAWEVVDVIPFFQGRRWWYKKSLSYLTFIKTALNAPSADKK